jgi:hypothetical protein
MIIWDFGRSPADQWVPLGISSTGSTPVTDHEPSGLRFAVVDRLHRMSRQAIQIVPAADIPESAAAAVGHRIRAPGTADVGVPGTRSVQRPEQIGAVDFRVVGEAANLGLQAGKAGPASDKSLSAEGDAAEVRHGRDNRHHQGEGQCQDQCTCELGLHKIVRFLFNASRCS